MAADAAEMEAESHAATPSKGGGKVRLKTLADLDRRTTAARVVFELRDSLAADLGGKANLSVMKLELIDNVACLGAMLKDTAADPPVCVCNCGASEVIIRAGGRRIPILGLTGDHKGEGNEAQDPHFYGPFRDRTRPHGPRRKRECC